MPDRIFNRDEFERHAVNVTTGDLDSLARLAAAQRDLHELADGLFYSKTSKRAQRQDFGRRLNAIAASLKTVELALGAKGDEEQGNKKFDDAMTLFLNERARREHGAGADDVSWNVKADLGDSWEIALWRDGEYAGLWLVTEVASERID